MSSPDLPPVISASRRTDIPAFYSPWLARRLDEGYALCANPYSGRLSRVSLDSARFFVFWTKHPAPEFGAVLDRLDARGIGYYVLYTLNDYRTELLEPGLPALERRIDKFIELSKRIGPQRTVWRFDPLVLTPTTGTDELIERIRRVGSQIHDRTERLVVSFLDVSGYRRVRRNLAARGAAWREWDEAGMREVADGLVEINREWGLEVSTCCEPIDLEASHSIRHGKCIDDGLIARISPGDPVLGRFLNGRGSLKDPGQRAACGCIRSRDIGSYDTCGFGCSYCYATSVTLRRSELHDPAAPLLAGRATPAPGAVTPAAPGP